MTKKDIINYVTETPQNTNPAILNTMLDQLSSGGGGGVEPLIVKEGETIGSTTYLDKTFGEIIDAFKAKRPVYYYREQEYDYDIAYDYDPIVKVQAYFNDENWIGSIEGVRCDFPVAGIIEEKPATLDELRAIYPHIYNG